MITDRRIPTEIIQILTASQAWHYMLVPFDVNGQVVVCYGELGRDYHYASQELAVVYNLNIEVTYVSSDELQKCLGQYYRNDGNMRSPQSKSISEIGSGQGFLIGLIEKAFDDYTSDIHIEPYEVRCRVRFRMDGKLIERYVIDKVNYASLINQIKIIANLDISEKRLPQDGRILFEQGDKKFDVRVSSLPTIYGEKIVLRLLTRHTELLDLKNLGFTDRQLTDYCNAIKKPHGIVLICGPTGSGKSTTLYATLRQLNNESGNILTIEDPVEYTLEGINQVQLKEEIGLTFTNALRTFLRQDPDIIMLGEIRDSDTAQMAIRSSLTGHLIFSTIHTNSALGSIARLTDMGIHPYLIADTMIMCVAQRLVRLLCQHCKQEIPVPAQMREFVQFKSATDICCYKAVGCSKCYYTGYSGRRAIYEVIPTDRELVTCVNNSQTDIEALLKTRNIVSLREAGLQMLSLGETSFEELIPMFKE